MGGNEKDTFQEFNLQDHVFVYGSRDDISSIIKQCEIGVLSSNSEGLPLSLLEYGLGSLAVVSTNVGYCKEVIDDGENGFLVEKENPIQLAQKLVYYIENVEHRNLQSKKIHQKVSESFSEAVVIDTLVTTYKNLL